MVPAPDAAAPAQHLRQLLGNIHGHERPNDVTLTPVRKKLSKRVPDITAEQVMTVALLVQAAGSDHAVPHLKVLREHAAFLEYDVKRCMLEFFLLAQCWEGANSKYDQEIIIQDDLYAVIPCFASQNIEIVSLDDLKCYFQSMC